MINAQFYILRNQIYNLPITTNAFCKLNLAILHVERAIYDFFIFQTLIFKYLILLSDAKLEKIM